tara:strand:- start:927 stop:1367 length:441 start_codon:yes stop_codon:yes gene_type:complete
MQAEGLALLDAELITLLEFSPLAHIEKLIELLEENHGVTYKHTILAQPNGNIHIGFLHKEGIDVENVQLLEGSEGEYSRGRRAISVDVSVGKFKDILIGVHLKSGRNRPEQLLRDSQCKFIGDYITQLRNTQGLKIEPFCLWEILI